MTISLTSSAPDSEPAYIKIHKLMYQVSVAAPFLWHRHQVVGTTSNMETVDETAAVFSNVAVVPTQPSVCDQTLLLLRRNHLLVSRFPTLPGRRLPQEYGC
jgi:hypothetical protein